jgi:hypothetical protein
MATDPLTKKMVKSLITVLECPGVDLDAEIHGESSRPILIKGLPDWPWRQMK